MTKNERAGRASIAVAAVSLCVLMAACADPDAGSGSTIELSFAYGSAANNNVYVAWIADEGGAFVQNLFVCRRLMDESLTNTALPHWRTAVLPGSSRTEVDAVTQATKAKQDFTVRAALKSGCPRRFTVYYETDQSFDGNDWFAGDQPALVYGADIDLDAIGTGSVALSPLGWAPNEGTVNPGWGSFNLGEIQSEMRYITNHRLQAGGFGAADPERSATGAVESISARIVP
jgi:hypothetical protein